MISAIKLDDGSTVDIVPKKNQLHVSVNSLGDELNFTIQESQEASLLWKAVEDFHKMKQDNEDDDCPAKFKQKAKVVFAGTVYAGREGEPSLTFLKHIRKQLRAAAPQYNSAIMFMVKRYKEAAPKLKAVKAKADHFVEFSFSIAKGRSAV
jgi:hypothetical protein